MKMMEKFRKYCEFEYQHVLAAKKLGLVDEDFCWCAVYQLLGTATFIKVFNPEIDIKEIYEEYKEKILKIY
jgi:hypothetical protein